MAFQDPTTNWFASQSDPWSNVDFGGDTGIGSVDTGSNSIPSEGGGFGDFVNPNIIKNIFGGGGGSTPAPTGGGGATGGNSIAQLLQMLGQKQPPNPMADISSLMGAFSSGEKANRALQGQFSQGYDRNAIEAQNAAIAARQGALKNLAQANFLKSGTSGYQPTTIQLGGKQVTLPNFGLSLPATSAAQRAGASGLEQTAGATLQPGGTYTPQPLSSYATPGLAEKIGSYGALGTGALGAIPGLFGQGAGGEGGSNPLGQIAGAGSTIAGLGSKLFGSGGAAKGLLGNALGGAGGTIGNILGKALPIAGIGTGIAGMIANKGNLSNILSGMTTGASLGSIVPGLGTLIGGGIGALAGGVEDLFNIGKPSQQELEGRSTQSDLNNALIANATPEQRAQAQQAVQSQGWKDPNQALGLIVTRDNLIKQGMSPDQAIAQSNQMVGNAYKGIKQGGQAVQSAYSPIMSMMGRG